MSGINTPLIQNDQRSVSMNMRNGGRSEMSQGYNPAFVRTTQGQDISINMRRKKSNAEQSVIYPNLGQYNEADQSRSQIGPQRQTLYRNDAMKSMGGIAVAEKRGVDDVGVIQNTQESEDSKSQNEIPFMTEPPRSQCINIPSLLDEINKQNQSKDSQSGKGGIAAGKGSGNQGESEIDGKKKANEVDSQRPDKVYLKNCKIYSQKHMDKLKLKIENYWFKPDDFKENLLSPVFFERLRAQRGIDFNTEKLSLRDLSLIFKTESMKLFVDFIFHEGQLLMIIKTWQKVLLRVPTEEAKKDKEAGRVIAVEDLRNVKGELSEEQFTQSNNFFYIKTLQVYDKFGQPKFEPILLEQVFGAFDSFRIYDASFMHNDGKLFFFKRQFLDRDSKQNRSQFDIQNNQSSKSMKMSDSNMGQNKKQTKYDQGSVQESADYEQRSQNAITNKKIKEKVYLQMYSLDIKSGEQTQIPHVYIEEEDWDAQELEKLQGGRSKQKVKQSFGPMDPTRSQYNIQFSAEFGPKSSHETSVHFNSIEEFLNSQYFGIQKYIVGQEFNPFRIFQIGDYSLNQGKLQVSDIQKPLVGLPQYLISNTNTTSSVENSLDTNRQLQFINHIKNFQTDKKDAKDTVNFLVQNMFVMVGIQANFTKNKTAFKTEDIDINMFIYRRKTVHQYQRIWNIGGIVPQKTRILQYVDGEQEEIDQYFFTDSRNNIQLLIPNYESKLKCQRRVEQIRDAERFSNKYQDYLMYKKITVQRIEDGIKCKCLNVFQKIDHLQSILDDDISCAQSFNFYQDLDHQILFLSESKSRHVIIYKMKDERSEKCLSLNYQPDEELQINNAFQKKMVLKKASTKQQMKGQTKKTAASLQMKDEVCDIDNQTSQAIKGTRPEDLRRNRPNQAYEIQDNDHDEPYASYQIKVTEDNINILHEVDDAGYGIIRLTPEEKRNYCLVDDFEFVKRKVKMFNFFESQQLRLINYIQAKNKEYCLFLFAVYNPDKNFDECGPQDQALIKRSYIFVRKNKKEMQSIFASNGDLEIIRNDDEVIILKNWNRFEAIKFTHIKKYQFEEELKLNQDNVDEENDPEKQQDQAMVTRRGSDQNQFKFRELSITLCKFQEDDKTPINFLPFIYQEKNNCTLNKLIVYDILNNKPTSILSMNPYEKQTDYVYENENGYNKFMLCRSSDLFEQPMAQKILQSQSSIHSKVKFQVFTLYSEKIGRLHCEEFIISHDTSQTKVETLGLKEILFSNRIISRIEWDIIRNSEVYPYLDKNQSCKGSKLKLILSPNEDGVWINMIDGEDTNIYFYKSDIVMCGNTKMVLREDDPLMFVNVTATILRTEIHQKRIFNRSQAFEVLSVAQDLMMRMKIPDLEYLVLNSFEDVRRKDFFRTQELLQGKSLADISLSSAESWRDALGSFRQEWKVLEGCVVENIIDGDDIRREHMQLCEFYPKLCIVQLDLNFMGTIERAFYLNSFKSLKIIFTHILDVIDTFEYQKFIMYELPIIIQQKQIQIDDFYNLSQAERKNSDKGFCNLEIELGQKEMPPFSDLEFDSFRLQNFDNFKQIENEIADEIWRSDENKAKMGVKDADKKFETEYFYIDYHHMILGETIRSYRKKEPHPQFNDLLYSKTIAYKVGESQRNSFFLQETIQKIIDSQWMQTKFVQKYIFLIYVIFYCVPMGMSCFQLMDSLMFNIAIWPAIALFLIEAIQFREQGFQYFTVGWNLIDSAQLIVFGILYYMRYMGFDRDVLYFPELKLVNIILTFLKLLFFVRIFEEYGFLVQMIILCLQDLVPFFMTYLLFLNFFSMCFIVLNCDIDGEISETKILTKYQLMVLQVYRTALGELSMPGYEEGKFWKDENGKLINDDFFKNLNITVIWILWIISTFFMFVIMTNFNIAQITSTYERVRGLEKKISYELKAEMNHETYMLLSIFTTLQSYRCIIFANTKNSQGKQTELLDDQFDQLKKSIMKNNQAFDGKNEEHMRKLKKVSDQQSTLKHFFKDKMNELIKRQEAMKMTLLDDVKNPNKRLNP